MMRPLPLIVLIALLAGPGLAAGPAKEKDAEEVDKTAEAEARLPNSMRRHGVIGHVPPMEGLPLLDAAVLERMRERLIVLSQGAEQ
ncbi:hypothetical protein HKX23_11830 [Sulfitobacter sp. KE29]|uniref:hypothetical protein n=1 Tax=unclassified Sulfitobacter TaxID=196795 RepID=UPI0007C21B7A|nr:MULTISPECIES: hypothetical protein [unclassified Sulfitobacter]KZY53089.1 hypothetical protein A3734_02195 [Sulfitobacter sp. HI0054]MBO9439163.1 hypothetical protein [Sulfitobacter sp. R18_2]MDF3419050.1 hypothetical protein [Sulfitobacter sp. Ks38]MDF3426532.1 hypothetical protein [Sulfitobacter sp. KE29]MDF3430113.1 hypothetical protein [Sulfitobacter sp. S46]